MLDGSMALSWAFEDERTSYSIALLSRLPAGEDAYVPSIWSLEVANAVLVGERRERISQQQADRFMTMLRTLLIQTDFITLALVGSDVLSLARSHRLSAYDASYLELAQRLSLPLATLDQRLREAAQSLGIALVLP